MLDAVSTGVVAGTDFDDSSVFEFGQRRLQLSGIGHLDFLSKGGNEERGQNRKQDVWRTEGGGDFHWPGVGLEREPWGYSMERSLALGGFGEDESEQSHAQQGGAKEEERGDVAASAVLDDAHEIGADESAEVPDGIDESDACCGSRSAEESSGHGPEWSDGAFKPDEGQRQ